MGGKGQWYSSRRVRVFYLSIPWSVVCKVEPVRPGSLQFPCAVMPQGPQLHFGGEYFEIVAPRKSLRWSSKASPVRSLRVEAECFTASYSTNQTKVGGRGEAGCLLRKANSPGVTVQHDSVESRIARFSFILVRSS